MLHARGDISGRLGCGIHGLSREAVGILDSKARKELSLVFAHSSSGVSKTEKGDVNLVERQSEMFPKESRILLPPSCTRCRII